MRKIALLASATSLAFAAKGDAAATTPHVAPVAPENAKADRVAPIVTGVRTDIPMPQTAPRGRESAYNFDTLEIGASIGVKNKTANDLSSIVSNQNRKHKVNKINADGSPVFKEGTTDPVKVASKRFQVFDVDSKVDPDGATARIFRVAI